MPIRKRVNKYEVTVHHKGGRYRRSFFGLPEAEQWEMQTKWALKHGQEIDLGETPDSEGKYRGPTMVGLMRDTIRYEWKGTRNERAASNNAEICVGHLGADRDPRTVTARDIDNMRLEWEQEGCSVGTITNRLSALSKMMTYALDHGILSQKPRIKRPPKPKGRIRFLSKDEEADLLAHLGGDSHRIAVLGIDTGMRLSEILNLERRDVGDREIHIWKNKTDTPRSIPLTDRAAQVIEELQGEDLFPHWTVDKFEYRWNVARRCLGLDRDRQFVPHMMRHTFCSRLAQRGMSPFVIMKLAGHKDIATTMRYVHLTTGDLRAAIDSLED